LPRDKHKWYEKPVRVLQFNIEDRYGAYVSTISGTELVELASRLHANVLVIFARDPWGRTYYRNASTGPNHPKMIGDLVRDALEEAKDRGIRVVVMVGHTANKYLYSIHSDWAQINRNGEIILLEHVPYYEENYEPEWPQLCINSPFIEHVKREVIEALKLGVDGVFLDSFRYQPDIERACYCKWCNEKFKHEYGYEMPRDPDWKDSRWRTLWNWRYKVVIERLKELYELSKKYAPDKVFMYNSHPGGWSGRTNRIVELAREYMDVVFAECSEVDHQPPGFITEMVKLTRAMSGGKPVWASRNYFHLYRTVSATTPLAIKQGLREAIIAGGSPWLLVFSISYRQDPRVLEATEQVFKEHEQLEEYLDGAEPLRFAGIVASNITRDHYGRTQPQHYVDEVRGFYHALTHSHIPVEFIADRDLENREYLEKYKVIILADTACMSDRSLQTIEEYVKNGGRVIATFNASTRNEEGIHRYDFGLREVFGIEEIGEMKTPWSYIVLEEHPVLEDLPREPILWGDMSYDFTNTRVTPTLGWHILVRPLTAEKIAHIGYPGGEWGYEYTLGRSPPPIASELDTPAITLNEYGRGLALYFSGQLGRHYWRIGLPVYKSLITKPLIRLTGKPPVTVNAPETLAVEVFRQGERYIVHLLNHTYNQRILAIGTGKTKQPLPPYSTSESVHPIRTIIPVHNVEVRLRVSDSGNYIVYSPLRRIQYQPIISNDNSISFTINRVDEYEVVVIEPKK